MSRLSKLASVFVMVLGFLVFLSYVLVTIGPVVACYFGLVWAACESGNVGALFLSIWGLPLIIAVVTSPAIVDYLELRRERRERQEAEDVSIEEE